MRANGWRVLSVSVLLVGLLPAVVARPQKTVQTQEPFAADPAKLKHPTLADTAPHRSIQGVIRNVRCSFPQVIEFRVEGGKKRGVFNYFFYNNNFAKIDLSVLGFDPDGPMDPCHQFEGMKTTVEYVPSREKGVTGQAMAVVLKK